MSTENAEPNNQLPRKIDPTDPQVHELVYVSRGAFQTHIQPWIHDAHTRVFIATDRNGPWTTLTQGDSMFELPHTNKDEVLPVFVRVERDENASDKPLLIDVAWSGQGSWGPGLSPVFPED